MKNKNIILIVGIIIIVIVLIIMSFKPKLKDNIDISKIEHIISIKSDDKVINAVTGGFCYKSGTCIDKIDFQDFDYDMITTYYDNNLYIENLDGNIFSVELFDYGMKEFTNIKVDYTDEYIVTPSISGVYIFVIKAGYEGKSINYYFMAKINQISGNEIDLNTDIKEGTLTNKGLTMVIKNTSDKDLLYGNPYLIEKYEDGVWKTLEPINEVSFTLPAYFLNKNDTIELNIDWEYGYGKLKGKYRVVKDFFYKENEENISFDKYLEFEL